MKTIKDFLGNEVKVGDKVVIISSHGKYLNTAFVLKVNNTGVTTVPNKEYLKKDMTHSSMKSIRKQNQFMKVI